MLVQSLVWSPEMTNLSVRGSDQLLDTMNIRTLLLIFGERKETATHIALKLNHPLAMINSCGACCPSRFNEIAAK